MSGVLSTTVARPSTSRRPCSSCRVKLVQRLLVGAGQARGLHEQQPRHVVQPRHVQRDAARRGQEAGRRRAAGRAVSAPCSAIACEAYSIATGASSPPGERSGCAASRWLLARQRTWSASQPSRPSSRHMLPLCGMRAAMPSRSSVCGGAVMPALSVPPASAAGPCRAGPRRAPGRRMPPASACSSGSARAAGMPVRSASRPAWPQAVGGGLGFQRQRQPRARAEQQRHAEGIGHRALGVQRFGVGHVGTPPAAPAPAAWPPAPSPPADRRRSCRRRPTGWSMLPCRAPRCASSRPARCAPSS